MDIIIPPSEIRTLIGKTATYVNKNGAAFENKIKSKESKNPKFVFLNENDPYHAYYQFVLNGIKETGRIPSINTVSKSSVENFENDKNNTDNQAEETEIEREPLQKPREFRFLPPPELENAVISPTDLAVMKLVAQFAVVNGEKIAEQFKNTILEHPQKSSQFQFLKETHSKYKLYQSYLKYFSDLWNNQSEIINEITQDKSKTEFLNRCFNAAEYLTKENVDLKEIEEKRLAEKIKVGSIDWQDFTLVETIEFTQLDEIAELHKPFDKANLEYRSLVQKGETSLFDEVDARSDAEVDDLDEERNGALEEAQDDITNNNDDDESLPTYADDVASDNDNDGTNVTENSEEKSTETKEVVKGRKIPKGMKIKAAGESRLNKRKFGAVDNSDVMIDPVSKEKLLRCPLTDKFVPESKFQAHISTLLRDPKYEEEKQRYESKFKYGSGLTTDQVYDNIQKLVRDSSNKRAK